MNKQHKKPRCDDMYRAILTLKTVDECKQFFDDLCTVTELQAMEQRYQVAQYLDAGLIYNDILEKTGASSATISRVNRSLQYGNGGYEIVVRPLRGAGGKKRRRSRRERLGALCRVVRCADSRCGICRVRGLCEQCFQQRRVPHPADFLLRIGTLTRLMAARGYEMIATDGSPDMLMQAQTHNADLLAEAVPPLLLKPGSVPARPLWHGRRGLPARSTGLTTCRPEGAAGGAAPAAPLFVRPGGMLIVDIRDPASFRTLDGGTFVDETDDVLLPLAGGV